VSGRGNVHRQPLAIRGRSRRGLVEGVAVLVPRLASGVTRAVWRLARRRAPESLLRRRVVGFFVRRTVEALNRGDLKLISVFIDRDAEAINTPDLVALAGFEAHTRGREALVEGERRWEGQWTEFRYQPNEVFDLGDDRLLALGRVEASGSGSGIVVDSEWGILVTVANGLVIREQNFLDRREALAAAGLQDDRQ
jgi:hypothetical protein